MLIESVIQLGNSHDNATSSSWRSNEVGRWTNGTIILITTVYGWVIVGEEAELIFQETKSS